MERSMLALLLGLLTFRCIYGNYERDFITRTTLAMGQNNPPYLI